MREIANEAQLDSDLSAVPPRFSNATIIALLLVLAALGVMIGSTLINWYLAIR
ncbi:hypothetical protein HHL25_20455 [Rhizobium sp. S-51]|uniref:Uncharacterized protein n=1 Tax=Rhizobium terricola TaxID=2728849 RepID=A0A7Y0AZR5_9HYPH|nr:hypothetical protein [Rhizobium terricola]NML76511.1 hypothetical protein [Rhizobium terricola]